jgi:membrane protease YdiL (CAAX protease family)
MIVVRREQGTLRWPVVKAALWLTPPTSPRTGKRGGKLWWLVLAGGMLLALEELVPAIPSPVSRDQAAFFDSSQGQAWMSGNWTWFAILIVLFVFNTVLGEELLFRGLMLPRMARFGRADWVVNGVLSACYHLHEPWAIPQTILVDTFAESGLSRRYRSSLLGIAVHSTQTVFFMIIGLSLVLG